MYLRKRIETLEASLAPRDRPIIGIWAMVGNRAMTDQEIEKEIAARKAAGAPANARFIPARWLTADDR